ADSNNGSALIRARSVVLATGGFGASRELIGRYITRWADHIRFFNAGTATGDGLTAALQIRAAPSEGAFNAFYGHHLPAHPPKFAPERLMDMYQGYSPGSIAVNMYGERYTDEGQCNWIERVNLGEELLAQDTARQPEAKALLVFDQRMYDQYLTHGIG